jgi:hypothetical protein
MTAHHKIFAIALRHALAIDKKVDSQDIQRQDGVLRQPRRVFTGNNW